MIASDILGGLVARGIPLHVAQGIVANMQAESGLNPGINEVSPLVPGSRGGYGLNQWTGPRRVQYEAFAAERGASPDDLNTQLDFTLWELQNTEKAAWSRLQGAQNAEDAARIYSDAFLRPGIPHMDRRLAYARDLAGMAPTYAAPPAQNALAPPPPEPNRLQLAFARQDPAAFQQQRNPLAFAPVVYDRRNVLGSLT